MPLEHPGSVDRSAEQAAERAVQQQQTQAELNELGQTVETEKSVETPAQRAERLGRFVGKHFSETCSAEYRPAAVDACRVFEDNCRMLFEEPDLQLAEEDATDPELEKMIEAVAVEKAGAVEKAKQAAAVETESDQATLGTENGKHKIVELNAHRQRELQAENDVLRAKSDRNDETIAANDHDIATLEQTQTRFDELKAEHNGDTIAALRSLLASDQLQSPEIREYLQNTIATAEALRSALPGKENVVTQLLNASSLNLAAGGGAATFADFMTAVDASEELTDADKTKLREVLHDPRNIKTGSDYAAAMDTTKQTPDGQTVPAYTKDEPLQFRDGVEGYASANGQQQFMRATTERGHGWELDVTNFTPTEKGLAANLLELWAMTENAGESDFLVSLTKIDLSVNNAIDPLALRDAAMITNATLGGYAGYNGEIFHGTDQIGIIRWQAQLRSPKGDAARNDRNADMTDDALQGLRIRDKDGKLDMDVLKAFGEYSRDNWFGAPDYEAVQAHLAKLFHEKFA